MSTLSVRPCRVNAPPRRRVSPHPRRARTVIRWDRAADQVHIWSAYPVTWRKLARLGFAPVRETRAPGGAVSGRVHPVSVTRFAWGLERVGDPPRAAPAPTGRAAGPGPRCRVAVRQPRQPATLARRGRRAVPRYRSAGAPPRTDR